MVLIGAMRVVGAMCALALLLMFTTTAQASSTLSAAAATAARSCEHHQLANALRSLSSANSTKLQKACATAHSSLTTVRFFRSHKHHWMLAPRYHKWWQVPGKRWRKTVKTARAVLRYHLKRVYGAVHKIEALRPKPQIPAQLVSAFTCIHHYEGAWNANTGNGYYGGLQMDIGFQSTYGGDFMRRWGTADNWPVWAQLQAAVRAYQSGRGFYPWPSTARVCGLI